MVWLFKEYRFNNISLILSVAEKLERHTEKRLVAGSIPVETYIFIWNFSHLIPIDTSSAKLIQMKFSKSNPKKDNICAQGPMK